MFIVVVENMLSPNVGDAMYITKLDAQETAKSEPESNQTKRRKTHERTIRNYHTPKKPSTTPDAEREKKRNGNPTVVNKP